MSKYTDLIKARREFPTYSIAIIKPVSKKSDSKGLTYDFMMSFIHHLSIEMFI